MSENPGPQTYAVTFAALILLLILTVTASTFHLGPFGPLITLAIAFAKMALVILYFMEVRYNSALTWLFAGAGFFWLAILIALAMTDYTTRGWLGS